MVVHAADEDSEVVHVHDYAPFDGVLPTGWDYTHTRFVL